MLRRLLTGALVLASISAPAARADGGPSPGLLLGGPGVLSANGAVRYVALGVGKWTVVEAVRTAGGRVLRSGVLAGGWGIPTVAFDGTAGGLSRDNRTLVLAEPGYGLPRPASTRFEIVDPHTFGVETITLGGDFSFDALSPDGRRLYLIQHLATTGTDRYVVRAYDLTRERLLPQAIAD